MATALAGLPRHHVLKRRTFLATHLVTVKAIPLELVATALAGLPRHHVLKYRTFLATHLVTVKAIPL